MNLKHYLATLHTRPEHHVRNFSLIVSGCFTLLIFALWLSFTYGHAAQAVAQAPAPESAVPAESPLESLKASAADAWSLISGGVKSAESGLKAVDIQNNYDQVRNEALGN